MKVLQSLLEGCMSFFEQEDKNSLLAVEDLGDVIEVLSTKHPISHHLANQVSQKAVGFIEEIKDPRLCWNYMNVLRNSPEPQLINLRNSLNAKVGKLIGSVSFKEIRDIPEWFTELLMKP